MNDYSPSLTDTLNDLKSSIRSIVCAYESSAPVPMAYQISYPRLEFVISGKLDVSIGNRNSAVEVVNLDNNSVLFVPENGWNRPEWEAEVETLSIVFANNIIGFSRSTWTGEDFIHVEKEHLQIHNTRISNQILTLMNEFTFESMYPGTNLAALNMLINFIIEEIKLESTTPNKLTTFDSIRYYIENNYQNDLTRELVAEQFHITPNHLSFIFKSQGHTKFIDFLNKVRLEHARHLLEKHQLSVSQIALRCGFRDANYFSRVFKKYNKITPIKYREYNSKTL